MTKCLVSCSGGLDSTTLLYYCKEKFEDVQVISFDYGSRQNSVERQFAKYHCDRLGVQHHIVDVKSVFNGMAGSCLLLNGLKIPEGEYKDVDASNIVVPFRNGIFLSICAGLADANNCNYIALAAHASDWSCYPDCRPQFTNSMKEAISSGTANNVELFTPFVNEVNPFSKKEGFTKGEIVKFGYEVLGLTDEDYKNTYSCYNGGEKHCGKCPTCRERKEAFEFAGRNDPTKYID